jgi:hypothetical protein
MASSNPTTVSEPQPFSGQHYTIQPRPHPGGGLLQVTDDKGQLVQRITQRLPPKIRYLVFELEAPGSKPLVVKAVPVGSSRIYRLFEDDVELLSLLHSSQGVFPLRDAQRKTIAQFIHATPATAFLRTPTAVVARVQFTRYPPPIDFRISCTVAEGRQWFLASLLYSISLIEMVGAIASASTMEEPKTSK